MQVSEQSHLLLPMITSRKFCKSKAYTRLGFFQIKISRNVSKFFFLGRRIKIGKRHSFNQHLKNVCYTLRENEIATIMATIIFLTPLKFK